MTQIKSVYSCAIASITTGVMLVQDFGQIAEASEWLIGHPIWTHEYPALADELARLAFEQFPGMPVDTGGNWELTRDEVLTKFGEKVEIRRGTAERKAGPISTLADALHEVGR